MSTLSITPTPDEVHAEVVRIESDLRRFAESKEAADAKLNACTLEHRAAEAELRRLRYAANLISEHLANLRKRMKGDLPVAILQIVDATAQNRVDLSPLGGIKKMREDESLCLLFYDEIGFYLREAEELTLATKEQTILAEADQIDALASQRDFDLELRLVPLAESEGQLLVDRGNTVTGELRRRAGETRMRAAAVRERLSEFQKTRRSL